MSNPTANNNNPTAALGAMPPEIAAQLREIGPRIEAQKTETYAVGTQDWSLSQPVLEFVRAHGGGT